MSGIDRPLVLLHGWCLLGPLLGPHFSKNGYKNGLFLREKPMCLGYLPCHVRLPTSKRSRMPLAGPLKSLLSNGRQPS